MPKSARTAAILVAAGRGLRAGSGGPKQYRSIGGQTVIFRAMEPFCRHPQVFAVQPVLNPDDTAMFNDAVSALRARASCQGRSDAAGLGACRARSARRPEARHRPDPRRRAPLRLGGRDLARDRGRRPHRRGDPGDCRHRYRQADRRRRKRRSHAGACAAADRANAAGVSVRCDSRRPSPRGARGPQRFHR